MQKVLCTNRWWNPLSKARVLRLHFFSDDTPEGIAVLSSLKRIFTLFNQDGLLGRELFIQSEILRLWPSILKRAQNAGSPVSALGNERIKRLSPISKDITQKKSPFVLSLLRFSSHQKSAAGISKNHRHVPLCLYQPIPYQKSLDLLSNTELTIAEVAQRCGFSTQSYYTSCFKNQGLHAQSISQQPDAVFKFYLSRMEKRLYFPHREHLCF